MIGDTYYCLHLPFFINSLNINVQLDCVREFLIIALNDSEICIELICVHKS